jgi:hypothetical protein
MTSASRVVWYKGWRRDELEELLLKGKNSASASLAACGDASRLPQRTINYKTTRDRVSLVSVGRLEYSGEWPLLYFISQSVNGSQSLSKS